jgi:hypothetical protein
MSTGKIKLLTWTVSGLLGIGMSLYVGSFLARKAEIEKPVDTARMKEILDNVPEPPAKIDDMMSIDEIYAALDQHNWSGVKPKAAPTPPPPKIEQPRTVPVASLVKLLLVKSDTTDDAGSNCVLAYQATAKVESKEPVVKYVGDRLDGGHTDIVVHAIRGIEVEFAFDDEARPHETLVPDEFQGKAIIAQADGTTPVPTVGPQSFPRLPGGSKPPEKTVLIGPTQYRMGTTDAEYIAVHYDEVLAEVRTRRWRDPNTGKFAGVQLSNVSPGSFAARHGAMEGDIIKSINGHPVTSTNEAVSFAKNNAELYDKWEIEVENQGRIRIVTYYPPN